MPHDELRMTNDDFRGCVAQAGAAHLDALRARAARALPPSARLVLEVGCGAGAFIAKIPGAPGRELIGIDRYRSVPYGLRITDYGFKFLLADLAALPFHDGAFDAIFCVNTLQVLDARRARRGLEEMARVARPGALVAVSFPNRANPVLRLRILGRAASYQGGGAPHAFYPGDVLRRLRRAGAEPTGMEAVLAPPYGTSRLPLWSALRRRLARWAHRRMTRSSRWAPLVLATAVKRDGPQR